MEEVAVVVVVIGRAAAIAIGLLPLLVFIEGLCALMCALIPTCSPLRTRMGGRDLLKKILIWTRLRLSGGDKGSGEGG